MRRAWKRKESRVTTPGSVDLSVLLGERDWASWASPMEHPIVSGCEVFICEPGWAEGGRLCDVAVYVAGGLGGMEAQDVHDVPDC